MSHQRKSMFIDSQGRTYLAKLGFEKGTTLVADRVEGDELAWNIRQDRVVTEFEMSILANAEALESMIRAGQESVATAETIELT